MTLRSFLPSVRLLLAALSLVAGLIAYTGQAHASRSQESIFQDDRLLQGTSPAVQNMTLDDLKSLGVTTVHTVINWRNYAPKAGSGSPPSNFNGADPTQYSESVWTPLDNLVSEVSAHGMQLLLTPAGPAPEWALGCTSFEKRKYGKTKGTCKPDPKSFGDFVTALATRYSGTYTDPATGATPGKVSRWSLWNEPNLNSWISPQIISIRGKRVPVSAAIYRNLVIAGGTALRAHGHSHDQILMGETAPIGLGTTRTSPVAFYEAVFCVDSFGHKLKGSAAKNLSCSPAKRLPVTGVAHHPYTKGPGVQPLLASQHSNDITIANINRLQNVLRFGARAHRISSSVGRSIFLDEFGVGTRPPARRSTQGVPFAKQADLINEGEYIAYLNSSVRGMAQFQDEDDAGIKTTVTFQTGLRCADGPLANAHVASVARSCASKAGGTHPSSSDCTSSPSPDTCLGTKKPSYGAYKMPLFVVNKGSRLTIWGGVRGGTGTVTILKNGKKFKNVRLSRGYFSTTIRKTSGKWQLTFTPPGSDTALTSRVAVPEKLVFPR